jgi:hypothetical protein
MMDGTFENRILERRATVAVCQHRGKKWMPSSHGWLFLCIVGRVVRYFSEIR